MRRAVLTVCALLLWACTPTEPEPEPAPPPTDTEPVAAPTPPPGDPGAAARPIDPNSGGIVPCGRSPADIMTVIGKHSQAINKCLVAGQKHKRLKKGTRVVELDLIVMPSGTIEGVQVHDEDARDNTVQICIGKVLDATKLPASKGGNCPVTLPLSVAIPSHSKKPRGR